MDVMNDRCVKMRLPNGRVADVLTPVLDEIRKWIQNEEYKPESGGYIIGYQHNKTGNISLESVSHPYRMDVRSRTRFDIRDPRHQVFLKKARRHKSYYMGVWHTHPERTPEPSDIDLTDWKETMRLDQTGGKYVFFIIAGTEEWRLWVGDFETSDIHEIFECSIDANGLYIKEGMSDDEKVNQQYIK